MSCKSGKGAQLQHEQPKDKQLQHENGQFENELQQQSTQQNTPAPFGGYTKTHVAKWKKKLECPEADVHNPATPKPSISSLPTIKIKSSIDNKSKVEPKTNTTKTPTATTKTEATKNLKSKSKPMPKPIPKLKTLQQIELEIKIIETKLQRLDHTDQVLMGYDHRIQDIQRNLSSAGFFERRKMQKEIDIQEQKCMDYQKDAEKQYGTRPQLNKELSKLLTEKRQIEDATGVTAAREYERQQKRKDATQQRQERDRQNAERKAKRLGNPSRNSHEPSL